MHTILDVFVKLVCLKGSLSIIKTPIFLFYIFDNYFRFFPFLIFILRQIKFLLTYLIMQGLAISNIKAFSRTQMI